MGTVKAVLDRARSQLGVRESPPGSSRTPYSEWYGDIANWCAMFVSWCLVHENVPLGPHPKGFESTEAFWSWFRENGKWSRTPAPGRIIFFKWDPSDSCEAGRRVCHVGIVESVKADGTVVTIEGNTGTPNEFVMRRNRRLQIVGYGIPDYEDTDDWFDVASTADLEQVVRKVLNEGTAFGQLSWAGTNQATLRSIQTLHNTLTQQVIPRLP